MRDVLPNTLLGFIWKEQTMDLGMIRSTMTRLETPKLPMTPLSKMEVAIIFSQVHI